MYTQAPSPQFYWHVWNEIYDGQRWISVDPTWDEVFVDAGHLKIADDDTIKIANSFGKIKIEILSFQTSDAIPTKGAFVEPLKPQASARACANGQSSTAHRQRCIPLLGSAAAH